MFEKCDVNTPADRTLYKSADCEKKCNVVILVEEINIVYSEFQGGFLSSFHPTPSKKDTQPSSRATFHSSSEILLHVTHEIEPIVSSILPFEE